MVTRQWAGSLFEDVDSRSHRLDGGRETVFQDGDEPLGGLGRGAARVQQRALQNDVQR